MKKKSFVYFILALAIALGACNEPVFYMISVEEPIKDPRINGSPTNFVVLGSKVYTASGGNIYSYDGISWDLIPQPGERIMQLAATDSYLYALCYMDAENNTILKRMPPSGSSWKDVTGDTGGHDMLQSVYAADDKVFIGAGSNNDFIVLYIDEADGDAYKPLAAEASSAVLCGLAYDGLNYYLCTKGDTIFAAPKDALETTEAKKTDGVKFAGIINLGIDDKIVAISRSGKLYNVTSTTIAEVPDVSFGDRPSTGALAVWRDADGPRLLLAGRQDRLDYSTDSGYTYGYLELELDEGGIKAESNFVEPGKNPSSSVADNERYVSTIGKYPVNHIFQTPAEIDPDMTLFASTHKNGVWSLRDRGTGSVWNAEE